MNTHFLIMILIVGILLAILWVSAGRIYRSHAATKNLHPFLFKLFGFNERYIDDRERWIRTFRSQLVLILCLYVVVLLALTIIRG